MILRDIFRHLAASFILLAVMVAIATDASRRRSLGTRAVWSRYPSRSSARDRRSVLVHQRSSLGQSRMAVGSDSCPGLAVRRVDRAGCRQTGMHTWAHSAGQPVPPGERGGAAATDAAPGAGCCRHPSASQPHPPAALLGASLCRPDASVHEERAGESAGTTVVFADPDAMGECSRWLDCGSRHCWVVDRGPGARARHQGLRAWWGPGSSRWLPRSPRLSTRTASGCGTSCSRQFVSAARQLRSGGRSGRIRISSCSGASLPRYWQALCGTGAFRSSRRRALVSIAWGIASVRVSRLDAFFALSVIVLIGPSAPRFFSPASTTGRAHIRPGHRRRRDSGTSAGDPGQPCSHMRNGVLALVARAGGRRLYSCERARRKHGHVFSLGRVRNLAHAPHDQGFDGRPAGDCVFRKYGQQPHSAVSWQPRGACVSETAEFGLRVVSPPAGGDRSAREARMVADIPWATVCASCEARRPAPPFIRVRRWSGATHQPVLSRPIAVATS